MCMLVLFKTRSICLFQSCNPRSHLDNVCTCMIEVERGLASGRTTCGSLDRHVLCILSVTELLGPSTPSVGFLKVSNSCAVLDSTLVAF